MSAKTSLQRGKMLAFPVRRKQRRTPKQVSKAKLLAFPVQHSCPTCGRMCSPEELSECLRCRQLYCSKDSWDCECDRTAREIVQRGSL
jgi:hypothetical protein